MGDSYNAVPPPSCLKEENSNKSEKREGGAPNNSSFLDAIAKARAIAAKVKEQHGLANEEGDNRKRTLTSDNRREDGKDSSSKEYERDPKRQYSIAEVTGTGRSSDEYRNNSVASSNDDSIKQEIELPMKTIRLLEKDPGYLIKLSKCTVAKFLISSQNDSSSEYGKATLTGPKDAVRKLKEMIDKLVVGSSRSENFDMNSFLNNYIPMSSITAAAQTLPLIRKEQTTVPGAKVGLVIGKGGETIRELMEMSGARLNVVIEGDDRHANPHRDRIINISGTEEAISRAKTLIRQVLDGEYIPSKSSAFRDKDGYEKESIQVPTDKVGLVIGRGGETIKSLMNQTRTKIFIEMPDITPVPPTRTINISGTRDNIEYAKSLIYEKIDTTTGTFVRFPMYQYPQGYTYPGQPSMNYPNNPNPAAYSYSYPGAQPYGGSIDAVAASNDPNASASASEAANPGSMEAYEAYVKQYNEYYQAYYSALGYSYPPTQAQPQPGEENQGYNYSTTQSQDTSTANIQSYDYPASTQAQDPAAAANYANYQGYYYDPSHQGANADPSQLAYNYAYQPQGEITTGPQAADELPVSTATEGTIAATVPVDPVPDTNVTEELNPESITESVTQSNKEAEKKDE